MKQIENNTAARTAFPMHYMHLYNTIISIAMKMMKMMMRLLGMMVMMIMIIVAILKDPPVGSLIFKQNFFDFSFYAFRFPMKLAFSLVKFKSKIRYREGPT